MAETTLEGDRALQRELEVVLRTADHEVVVESIVRLTGGASRSTSAVATRAGDGTTQRLILQQEPGDVPRRPEGMAAEAAVVTAAGAVGVPVPAVIVSHGDVDVSTTPLLGTSWFISEAIDGETIARPILRDDRFAAARRALPRQLGSTLAALHATSLDGLDFLESGDELAKYRDVADELGLVSPAFELAFRWLERHRPPPTRTTLVHGDFRLGNLIVDETGLAAVIDWELAHVGDPMEDLGWVCVRAWRFGGKGPVAGVGEYDELFDSYAEASGVDVDPEIVRWWEVLGTLKWGVMCGTQAERHRSGATRSVELAAIGRRIPEQEHDLMRLIA